MEYTLLKEKFTLLFGDGAALYASPGRVNLIGEHTDYNGGFVLPGAIDKVIAIAIKPNNTNKVRAFAFDLDESCEFDLDEKPSSQWACYIYGVIFEITKRGLSVSGFDCVFGGDVPLGAGLSSSAALESVFGFALNDLFKLSLTKFDLAKIGQAAEHNAVGVRCGIMDQFASVFGEEGSLIRLDCRSLDYELVPFHPIGYRVVLLDTKVKHSLASSEYNIRRAECEAGVAVVKTKYPDVELLRDVTMDMLNEFQAELPESTYRRCSYVIEENQRLLDACEALKQDDYKTFGERMYGSHEGLSKKYNVSCEELDFLVEVARKKGSAGSRMMGGGFGGCTINLIQDDLYEPFIAEAKRAYNEKFGKEPGVYEVHIKQGSHRVERV
jgi:galactokinase